MQPIAPTTALSLLTLLCAACSESCPVPAAAEATIGVAGGTLAVTSGNLAGVSITFPPGSLSTGTTIRIFENSPTAVLGQLAVGPAARIDPLGLQLSAPAVLQLPFDPAIAPPNTTAMDYAVYGRDFAAPFELQPSMVDEPAGSVTANVDKLATYWTSVRDVMVSRDYLPLNDGDTYVFSGGPTLTVSLTNTEPNFENIPIAKLTRTDAGTKEGWYVFIDVIGNLLLQGRFDEAVYQERFDLPVRWLNDEEPIGNSHTDGQMLTGFASFGSNVPSYVGVIDNTTDIVTRTQLDIALGKFDDVVQVQFTLNLNTGRPELATELVRMWLARDVGPIRIELDGSVRTLNSGTVGGQPVMGQ